MQKKLPTPPNPLEILEKLPLPTPFLGNDAYPDESDWEIQAQVDTGKGTFQQVYYIEGNLSQDQAISAAKGKFQRFLKVPGKPPVDRDKIKTTIVSHASEGRSRGLDRRRKRAQKKAPPPREVTFRCPECGYTERALEYKRPSCPKCGTHMRS